MAYTVAANDPGEYVHVVHSGVAEATEIRAARAEAVRVLTDRRWRRFLVDLVEVENAFSTLEHFNLISSTVAQADMARTAIAVVVDAADFGNFRFAENVAVNRSLSLKIFTDAGSAVAWLTGQ